MFFRPFVLKVWPSEASFSFWYSIPPGYFGFNSPSALRVLQNGILSSSLSQLARADKLINIPAVIEHVNSAPCFLAKNSLISLIVIIFPL